MQLLFKEFTNNHEITVYDTTELYGEKGSFRVLQFSKGAIQGAMDLQNPNRILFEYPRAIIHLMEHNNPAFEDVFMIGHGIGTIAGYFSEKRIKIAELDTKIVEISKRYFGYRKDNVTVGDGRQILGSEEPHVYDYILLDAFTDRGTPLHLTSREFFRMTREKLDSRGSIIMNLLGKGANDKRVNAIHATLSEQFAYTQSFSLLSEGTGDIQNFILMGRDHPIRFRARDMAGFTEVEPGEGHIIADRDR